MVPRRGPFFLGAILVSCEAHCWPACWSRSLALRARTGRSAAPIRTPCWSERSRHCASAPTTTISHVASSGSRGRPTGRRSWRDSGLRAQNATTYAPLAAYARLLSAHGDAAGAAAGFSEALRVSPDSVPALVGRARALAVTGDRKGSLATYERALAHENRPSARRRLIEAQLELLAGFPDDADPVPRERSVQLRRELTALDPDHDGAAERLADALERAGRAVPKRRPHWRRACRHGPRKSSDSPCARRGSARRRRPGGREPCQ